MQGICSVRLTEHPSRMHCEWDTGLGIIFCGHFLKLGKNHDRQFHFLHSTSQSTFNIFISKKPNELLLFHFPPPSPLHELSRSHLADPAAPGSVAFPASGWNFADQMHIHQYMQFPGSHSPQGCTFPTTRVLVAKNPHVHQDSNRARFAFPPRPSFGCRCLRCQL